MKLQINNLPVWGIENNVEIFVPNKNIKTNDEQEEEYFNDDIDLNMEKETLNNSTLKQLTMFVDYKSTSKDIITVTTDDAKFYYEEKKIDPPYKIPIPLIKLQPNQSIIFSAITNIGIEKISSIYAVVSVCFYKEILPNEFEFIIESRGSLTEKRIIHVGLINIIEKLKNFIKNLPSDLDNNNLKGEIIIMNEDSTLGNLISHGLQKHKKIKFAGFNIPHLLEQRVILHYELNVETPIYDVINDIIKYYIKIYENMIDKNNLLKI